MTRNNAFPLVWREELKIWFVRRATGLMDANYTLHLNYFARLILFSYCKAVTDINTLWKRLIKVNKILNQFCFAVKNKTNLKKGHRCFRFFKHLSFDKHQVCHVFPPGCGGTWKVLKTQYSVFLVTGFKQQVTAQFRIPEKWTHLN